MSIPAKQNLIFIEGAATYERVLSTVGDLETEEGIRHLKDFLKIYPGFARAHNDLAVLYYRNGNLLMALAHYEKAHKLDPSSITYRKNLADFYFVVLEWPDDSIHIYLDILHDNPFDTEALNSLGSISLNLGRQEQAKQYYSRTLQLDAGNKDAKQAFRLIDPSLLSQFEIPPQVNLYSNPDVFENKPVQSLIPKSPLKDLMQNLRPDPLNSPEELHREAISSINEGLFEDAIQKLETLLLSYKDYALAHNDLGVLYQKRGELPLSRKHHEEAVKLNPDSVVFRKNLADLLYKGFGDMEEALRIYVGLQENLPQDIEILKAIANICEDVGNPSDAMFFLERVLTLQPWDREALDSLKKLKNTGSVEEL